MKQTLYLPKHLDEAKYRQKYKQISHHKENHITLYSQKTSQQTWLCFLENTYQQDYISIHPITFLCFNQEGHIIDQIILKKKQIKAKSTHVILVNTQKEVTQIKLKLPHVLIDQSKQVLPTHIFKATSHLLYENETTQNQIIDYLPVQIKKQKDKKLQVKLIIRNNSQQTQIIHQLPIQLIDQENQIIAQGTFQFQNLTLLPYSCQLTQIIFPQV